MKMKKNEESLMEKNTEIGKIPKTKKREKV
jgi:hypothetical protein